jgi:hypothetical protein
MNIDHPNWHKWVMRALDELKDNYEYGTLRAKVREYYEIDRMKRFLKVGEYNQEEK